MQPRVNLLEKAFNQLMSCGGSRCCVCSVLESPNPFSKFDRKKLEYLLSQLDRDNSPADQPPPLTVMVQRSMVTLPQTLLTCNSGESDLVTCSECNVCVHRCELNDNKVLLNLF